MKRPSLLLLIAVSAGAVAQSTDLNPGSLWPTKYVNPLLDRTARTEGDIITILISESSVASYAASTKAEKADATEVDQPIGKLLGSLFTSFKTGATSTVDGKGATSQSGSLVARMTAIVKKVLPNGNLVIEGTRSVQINKEVQTFKVSGVIRRDDIRSDNTVLSESIAEASITADGKGMISERTRRGILTRLLDWLF